MTSTPDRTAIEEAHALLSGLAKRLCAHSQSDLPRNTLYDLGRAIGWLEIAQRDASSPDEPLEAPAVDPRQLSIPEPK